MRSFVKIITVSIQFFLLLFLKFEGLFAQQDPQLSQFYAAPLFINPAMAGGSMMPRVMVNYRNQWPGLTANYSTSLFSADYYSERYNSGFGLLLMNDSQGLGRLTTNAAALQYAFHLRINEENSIRFGIEGSYANISLDNGGLIFGDQYVSDPQNRGFNNLTKDPLGLSIVKPIDKVDVAGGMLYYNPKFWIGGAAHHLTGSRESYVNQSSDVNIPRKISAHGGFNIPLGNANLTRLRRAEFEDHDIVLTIAANYKKQGSAQQLDMGTYLTIQPMTIGLWYRGVPVLPKTNDALIALIGFRQDKFSVGYSYDLTISGLGVGSGGSHEISIRYEFEPPDRYDRMRIKRRKQELSCPKF